MNPRHQRPRLVAAALALASACLPSASLFAADASVFKSTFSNDVLVMPTATAAAPSPGPITSTGTNWYVLSSKDGRASSLSGGLIITYAANSTAAGVQAAGRFTTNPLSLAAVGDSITANATLYTSKVQNISFGLYNSGGVDPLSTLANGGLSSTIYSGASTDGTLGWKGYRARVATNSAAGTISARAAQTGASLAQSNFDVASVNTGDFASPGPISIGVVPDSASTLTIADGLGAEYRLAYTITRSAADALTISYTVRDSSSTVLYSVSGTTTTAAALPSAITSTFDSLALGNRNDAPSGGTISQLWVTEVSVTAKNAQVALISDQPLAQSWVPGVSGSISVAATGAAPLGYQWYKDGSPISGATSATYTVAAPAAGDMGSYHVVVSNAYGASTSVAAYVNVTSATPPAITAQPSSLTVNEGETLALSAEASGAPTPSYQWYKVGTGAISGATQPTYTVTATTAATAGSYYVVATNGQGSPATSNTATVTINSAPPAIVTEPLPATINVGQGIALSVTTSGYPAPSYQWYKGAQPNGTPISGSTGAAYTVPSATTADAGTYYVVATNLYGTATSTDTAVVVNVVPPSITTQPSSATVTLGQPVSFTVGAGGTVPLSYQWYKGAVGSGSLISGANSSTYTIATTTGSSAGDYYVVVTNDAGTATSNAATLSLVFTETTRVFSTDFSADLMNPATPVITPTSTAWYVMSSKNARVSTIGDNPRTTDVVETNRLVAAMELATTSGFIETAARFANTPVSLSQVGSELRATAVIVTNNVLTLGFGLYNSGGVHPKQLDFDDTTKTAAERTVLSASGSSALGAGTQNWIGYRATLGNLAGSGTVSQGAATRPAQINTVSNRGQELCVTGSGSVSYGEPAGVSVSVTKTPSTDAAGTLALGGTYTLVLSISRSAADEYTYAYQIYEGAGTTGTLFRAASGKTTAVGTKPSETTGAFDAFALGIRNANNASIPWFTINAFSVDQSVPVVGVAPAITTQPVGQTLASGATLTLTAAASGSPTPTYQWYKDDVLISGATSATYTVASATTANTGSYKVVATNAVSSATSDSVTVTVTASSPYESWSSEQGLTGANNGATQDPDGDGVPNLVEFALGGNPLSAASAPLPVVARDGANITFTYDVKTAATAQFAVTAQSSTDLATWTAVVHGSGGATIASSALDASTNRVVVTLPATAPRLFVRLQVAALP